MCVFLICTKPTYKVQCTQLTRFISLLIRVKCFGMFPSNNVLNLKLAAKYVNFVPLRLKIARMLGPDLVKCFSYSN